MARGIPDDTLVNVSAFLASEMGLLFPRERWDDLASGLTKASRQLGFADVEACIGWLLSAPLSRRQVETLAGFLTIGETYFFRDPKTLEAAETEILPALVRARRDKDRQLRIWSAGCSTGEEPYTLAILLHRLLPDLDKWHVTILATDINADALKKGIAGCYGKWSFRATPSWFKTRYFTPQPDGALKVAEHVRRLVSFEYLNLAEDGYPSLSTNTNAMDVIFCRNVLMYFAPDMARTALSKLYRCLVDGGWLILGPAENPPRSFIPLEPVSMGGVVCYRKRERERQGAPQATAAEADAQGTALSDREPAEPVSLWQRHPEQRRAALERAAGAGATEVAPDGAPGAGGASFEAALLMYRQGWYPQAAAMLTELEGTGALPAEARTLLIRSQANQGRLPEALASCERALAADKLDPALHYLLAEILQEQGRVAEAQQSLTRALYLDPQLVLAHFALGNLALWSGSAERACRHFANALALLDGYDPAAIVPGSEGITAGRLKEIIASMSVCSERGGGP